MLDREVDHRSGASVLDDVPLELLSIPVPGAYVPNVVIGDESIQLAHIYLAVPDGEVTTECVLPVVHPQDHDRAPVSRREPEPMNQ